MFFGSIAWSNLKCFSNAQPLPGNVCLPHLIALANTNFTNLDACISLNAAH